MSSQAAFRPMNEILRMPVQELVSPFDPVTLSSKATLKDALSRLGDNGLLSAPVVDDQNAVHGFIDYLDIATFLVSACEGESAKLSADLLNEPVTSIVGTSQRNPYIHILGNNPATLAVEFFSTGIHRCAVFNAESRLSSILSQSDIVRYVSKHIHLTQLKSFATTTVQGAGWGRRRVVSVPEDESTFSAVQLMMKHKISSLAVINNQGELIGNFSVSDLRGVTHDIVQYLLMPVGEFLGLKSPGSLKPMCTTLQATIRDTINMLAKQKLHRLWIVNDNGNPTGVISQTDVMNALFHFSPSPTGFAVPVPGVLTVSILGAKNLKSGWSSKPYVVVNLPGQRTPRDAMFCTPSTTNPTSPEWKNQTFNLNVNMGNAYDRLLFIVKAEKFFGSDDDLGFVTVSLDWVLSGFGCGPACRSLSDFFILKSRSPHEDAQGELELSFEYKPSQESV